MALRYLFGPVAPVFIRENLARPFQTGECLPFGDGADIGFHIGSSESWQDIASRLPAGWQPDVIVLYLPYTTIRPGLWDAPVPIIGLAADWNLLWHAYMRGEWRVVGGGKQIGAAGCDLVLTDTLGVEVFEKEWRGWEHAPLVRRANLFGLGSSWIDPLTLPSPPTPGARVELLHGCGGTVGRPATTLTPTTSDSSQALLATDYGLRATSSRDIDILFVGNVHPAVQRERLPWIARLSRLANHRRVVIEQAVFGEEYRKLLSRARIVFNRSIRGECNKRAFEAAAAGALLFQEEGNLEIGEYFEDGKEFVSYNEENLDSRLEYYLDHEEERLRIAEAGREKVREYTFEKLWQKQLEVIEGEWEAILERCEKRIHNHKEHKGHKEANGSRGDAEAAENTDSSCPLCPSWLIEIEKLVGQGRQEQAIAEARAALQQLDSVQAFLTTDNWQTATAFEFLRVEWERAAWINVGNPECEAKAKRELVRWKLHHLLGQLTGESAQYYEAVLARPDLPNTRAGLGCALASSGKPGLAIPHLREAVEANPFDLNAARALFQALGDAAEKEFLAESAENAEREPLTLPSPTPGRGDGADTPPLSQALLTSDYWLLATRALARDRRLLSKAAPHIVPPEEWFMQAVPAGDELVSIIILCCNEVAYSRLCLASVLRHTRGPYELVIVDNGSTDGTDGYLEELKERATAAGHRVEVITNQENVGFAAGCNQALKRCRGDYIVFLNNDTIVTEGWLEGLVAWSLHDWPKNGLVGPMSNYAPDPQYVEGWRVVGGEWRQESPSPNPLPPGERRELMHGGASSGVPSTAPYKSEGGRVGRPATTSISPPDLLATDYCLLSTSCRQAIDAYAAQRRHEFAGKALGVQRLTGFCLLARRDVLERIGSFDEQYALGFFEDDDLCVRAREAGFHLLVACDVFVHHFGSRTFAGLGIDCTEQLKMSLERFRTKWGEELAGCYHMPGTDENNHKGHKEHKEEFLAEGAERNDYRGASCSAVS
jgi:GT2 family glycosyltransferase